MAPAAGEPTDLGPCKSLPWINYCSESRYGCAKDKHLNWLQGTSVKSPHLVKDGSHIIPVTDVHCVGLECCSEATGELRWHPETGANFTAHFPGVSHTTLPQYFSSRREPAKTPDWTAKTADGSVVSIFSLNSTPFSTLETGTAGFREFSRVEVEALYACVDLRKCNPLSHWHYTTPNSRVFCLGFGANHWAESDNVTFEHKQTITTIGRGSIELQSEPSLRLVSGGQHNLPIDVSTCWIVAESESEGLDYPLRSEMEFVSFLNGRRTPFVWHDRFLNLEQLRRTYYGWHRTSLRDLKTSYTQPLPLYGTVDSIRHAKEVVPKLAALFRAFSKLTDDVRFTWILNPLWTGRSDILDDHFTHACVSLERLAEAWNAKCEKEKRPKAFSPTQVSGIQDALSGAVLSLIEPLELTKMQSDLLNKRINSICAPTNADKLARVFCDVGVTLTSADKAILRDRNIPLHGRPTLTHSTDTELLEAERDRTDRLHTLISEALLRLLGYSGPYINFAARGASHVEYL